MKYKTTVFKLTLLWLKYCQIVKHKKIFCTKKLKLGLSFFNKMLKTFIFNLLALPVIFSAVSECSSNSLGHLFTLRSLTTSCCHLLLHSLVVLDGVFTLTGERSLLFPFSAETVFLYVLFVRGG